MIAYTRNEVELGVRVRNLSNQPYWIEVEVSVPADFLSLHPTSHLKVGRIRGGIIFGGEEKIVRCKIYANSVVHPDNYKIGIVTYAYGKDGTIYERNERIAELRCDSIR
jgi:uncharacterized membrane protein